MMNIRKIIVRMSSDTTLKFSEVTFFAEIVRLMTLL
jgi:hypothetical protein